MVFVALLRVHGFPKACWATHPQGRYFMADVLIYCRQPHRFCHENGRSEARSRKAIRIGTYSKYILLETRRGQSIGRTPPAFRIDSLPVRVPDSLNRVTNSVLRHSRSPRLRGFCSELVTSSWEAADRCNTVKRAKASIHSQAIRS